MASKRSLSAIDEDIVTSAPLVDFQGIRAVTFLQGQINADHMFLARYWGEVNPQQGHCLSQAVTRMSALPPKPAALMIVFLKYCGAATDPL